MTELDREALVRLVERASLPWERLASDFASGEETGDDVERRLERWRSLVASGDRDRFTRRLAWDDLDERAARRAVSPAHLRPGAPLPAWANTLGELAAAGAPAGDAATLDALLQPLVLWATERVSEAAGPSLGLLGPDAIASLQALLVRRLRSVCDDVVRDDTSAPTGGLARLLESHPVMARLAAVIVSRWVQTTGRLVEHLRADGDDLRATFGGGTPLGRVEALTAGRPDPSHHADLTLLLTFASGLRLAYKPRAVRPEAVWFALLRWLDERGAPPQLRALSVVDAGDRGWMEFAAADPCHEERDVQRYYRRAGAMVALVHALGGSDVHGGNLIAAGDQPTLIDLEVILRHRPRTGSRSSRGAAELLALRLSESVLGTLMLPRFSLDHERHPRDRTGLGGGSAPRSNMPVLEGERVPPHAYGDAIEAGFEEMYGFLVTQRDALLAADGPLAAFAGVEVRFIFRETRTYQRLLRWATRAEFLRDGADFGVELDAVARALSLEDECPALWPLVAAERAALERAVMPVFMAPASSDGIEDAGGVAAPGCFEEPAFDRMRSRVRDLDAADLARQKGLIRASLVASGLRHEPASAARPAAGEPLERAEMIGEAVAIGDRLAATAFAGEDGDVAWPTLRELDRTGRFAIAPTDLGLYGGACGIALFLAALHRICGEPRFERLARAALRPVRRAPREGSHRVSGVGALAYGLVRTADALADDSLLDDARQALSLVRADVPAAELPNGVLDGRTGLILGLLALHATGDDVLSRASEAGRCLLEGEVEEDGFAHGRAGAGYALLRLAQASGDSAVARAGASLLDADAAVGSGWCRGLDGVALARAASGCDLAERDVDSLLAAGLEHDHLCCGQAGRVDVLLELSKRLDRPELADAARASLTGIVRSGKRLRLWSSDADGVTPPGLFDGLGGIGYALLRCAEPDVLPCVPLFE